MTNYNASLNTAATDAANLADDAADTMGTALDCTTTHCVGELVRSSLSEYSTAFDEVTAEGPGNSATEISDFDTSIKTIISESEENKNDNRQRNIQHSKYIIAQTDKYNSENEALKGIFFALVASLIIVSIMSMGYLPKSIAIVAVVIAITIAVIYASGILIMSYNRSYIDPHTYDWDFSKDPTGKGNETESFSPHMNNTSAHSVGISIK